MYWRRFALSTIPINDPATFELWLRDRWREKDALIEEYVQNGRFPADEGHDAEGVVQGAGFIETTVRLAQWYEIGDIFLILTSLAITAHLLAQLWNLLFIICGSLQAWVTG